MKELGQNTEFCTENNWGGVLAINAIKDEIHMKNILTLFEDMLHKQTKANVI